MKFQVELTNCLKYKDKKTGNDKVRLGYRLKDNKYNQNSLTFKGYAEMSYFLEGTGLFDKMKSEYFGMPAELTMEEQPSPSNPMRKIAVLKQIRIGNEVINV